MNADLIEKPSRLIIKTQSARLFCIRQSRSTFSSQLRAFTLYLKYFSQVDLKSCFLFCSHCLRLQRLMPSLSAYSLCVRPSFIRIALICLPGRFSERDCSHPEVFRLEPRKAARFSPCASESKSPFHILHNEYKYFGIYRRSQLRLSAASLSGIEASGACPLFQ